MINDIFFDNIIFSLQKTGGISVVWSELLSRIVKEYKEYNITCLEYNNSNLNIFRSHLNLLGTNIIIRKKKRLMIKRYLNILVAKEQSKFIFHSSYYRIAINKTAINITTVHDFTYEYFCKGLKKKLHSWQKFRAIRNSDFIICVSENTKKDLIKFLPDIKEEKIRVIYNGVSDDYFQILENNKTQLPFSRRSYVLYVGGRDDYKNFNLAVKAISLSKYNLIIVGSSLSNKEKHFLNHTIGELRFKFVGYISNQELNILYNNAFVLLYPSIYEGFGIPILEAQKAGCPVIAYKGSSISEIIGNTPLLIENLSVNNILKSFNILENDRIRSQVIFDGLRNSNRFTWDRMYNQIMSVYNEAWNSKD